LNKNKYFLHFVVSESLQKVSINTVINSKHAFPDTNELIIAGMKKNKFDFQMRNDCLHLAISEDDCVNRTSQCPYKFEIALGAARGNPEKRGGERVNSIAKTT